MRRRFGVGLLVGAAALMAACDNGSTSSGPGKLTVLLTDAPFSTADVKSASIYIKSISCRRDSASDEEAEDTSSTGWTMVVSPNQKIDLLVLNNGVTLNLGTQTIPAGTWNACRIVIDPAQSSVMLNDGTTPNIKWPSAGQSGIKVLLNEPVTVQDSSVLVVDFDVGSSFVLRGNDIHNDGLLFKPVVHGVVKDVAAALSGFVKKDSANGAVASKAIVQLLPPGTAVNDSTTAALRTAVADSATGAFTFNWLVPGSYALRAIPAPADTATYKAALFTGGVTLADNENKTGVVVVLPKK